MDKNTGEGFAAKINQELERVLSEVAAKVEKDKSAWLAGYFAGLKEAYGQLAKAFEAAGSPTALPHAGGPSDVPAQQEISVFYASQSGNGKGFSKKVSAAFEAKGFKVRVIDLATYKCRDIKNEKTALFIISTHGEGEPPPAASEMFEFLKSTRAPKLEGLHYSVLALGDKSYVQFCQAGRVLDELIAALGGKKIFERVECDADFEASAQGWLTGVVEAVNKTSPSSVVAATPVASGQPAASLKTFGANNPFEATVLSKINLNGRGSLKETYHVEISLDGVGVTYQAGDACGLIAQNSKRLVAELLEVSGLNGNDALPSHNGKLLFDLLRTHEISVLTPDVIRKHNALAASDKLKGILGNVSSLKEYVYGRDFIDLLKEFPVKYSSADLLSVLRPIPARLYSIASSPSTYEGELHLLVGAVRYNSFGRDKEGVASTFWADRIEEGGRVPVYLKSNEGFRLPADGRAPIIMVGPGTGVAPFRAFVEERAVRGDEGKSWLFFGNPNFTTDFLYQTEWQAHVKEGRLTKMDVAFSRDQEDKHYVQHRILAQAQEVYSWIKDGAYIYVCGDMKRMAADVYRAFGKVIEEQGSLSEEAALTELKDLRKAGRYLEDVY